MTAHIITEDALEFWLVVGIFSIPAAGVLIGLATWAANKAMRWIDDAMADITLEETL